MHKEENNFSFLWKVQSLFEPLGFCGTQYDEMVPKQIDRIILKIFSLSLALSYGL